jgi:uncharacterized protein
MSELINNSEKRKELLKHMILQLHKGEAPENVRNQLVQLLQGIPYDEVVEVEQELINEGLPTEEVLKFCDIHTMVLEGKIDQGNAKSIPIGHPIDTFKKENRELERVSEKIKQIFQAIEKEPVGLAVGSYSYQVLAGFNQLMDIDKHYRRKENLLFPFLEKKGITGPPTVMWGKHDEVRSLLKDAIVSLNASHDATVGEFLQVIAIILNPAIKSVADMIMKEEEILFPMTMDEVTESEWYEIYLQSDEIGYCLFDPAKEWKPASEGISFDEIQDELQTGSIRLPSGSFTVAELKALLNALPVDITFVDKNDKVKFFTQREHRIFDRNRAILGRDVRMCHPPQSVHIVDQILSDFKSGKEKCAPFWIQMEGKFIYINYYPLSDKDGNYLGTFEFSQDLTELRALEGEQRLLSYGKS